MACVAEPTEITCADPTARFYECCGATVEAGNTGFQSIMADIEQLLTQLYQVALTMLLSDKAYNIKKAASAAKCAVTSFLINAWYPLASVYVLLEIFNAGHFISGVIDMYYPVLCSCKIEMA